MKTQLLSLLLLGGSLIAETPSSSFMQGEILPKDQYPAAYNAPSQVKLQKADGSILTDLFFDLSFLYYHADQEGFDLGTSAALVDEKGTFLTVDTGNSQTAFQSFDYKPGFKVGVGARFCDWTLGAEYTWVRQTVRTTQVAPNPHLAGGTGVWIANNWFEQNSSITDQPLCSRKLHSKWHLAVNLADLMLSRACYEGRALTVSPAFGLRGAWISQSLRVGLDVPEEVVTDHTGERTYSNNSSKSWALGPRAALGSQLLLGKGFRLEGDVAGSMLFTKYTHVKHKENVASSDVIPSTLRGEYENYNCLRPVGELSLGTGWGSYFCGQKYHMDFFVSYDFQVFWDQNMMRKLMDSMNSGVGGSAGNLNLHGLRVTASFDF